MSKIQDIHIPKGWKISFIWEYLDYEQPTKYIVSSTDYSDIFSTPVLTANKGFIIGYTDEKNGIYDKWEIVLFDDFTMDLKYVDFNFKVKSSALKILVEKEDGIIKYLYYVLKNEDFSPESHKRHYLSEIEPYSICIPKNIKEKQKIAEILSTIDDAIEKTDKLIEKYKKVKTGLMEDLFTKWIDVNTGKPHTKFKDSELGKIPESWWVDVLDNVCTKIWDGIHTTPIYSDNPEYHFINGNNLKNWEILITESTKCVSYEEYRKHQRDLGKQTILMSINGTIGNLAFYQDEKVILGKSSAFINIKQNYDKYFLYYLLSYSKTVNYYDLELTWSTIKNLGINSIKNTPIPILFIDEQNIISRTILKASDKIEKEKGYKEKLEKMKKGLMNDLLTGKVRVRY